MDETRHLTVADLEDITSQYPQDAKVAFTVTVLEDDGTPIQSVSYDGPKADDLVKTYISDSSPDHPINK